MLTETEDQPSPPAAGEGSSTPARAGRSSPARGSQVLRVLRRREFAIFWVGNVISLVGTWMQHFTQGLVVTDLTTSALALGLVNFASAVPSLLLTPFGGVAADRHDRRLILIGSQWAMGLLAFAVGWLLAMDRLELWHLYVVALLLGIAMAYDLPAYQAFYPELVEREELPQAISLNQAAFHGSRIIGPAVAGWVVGQWGTAAAFYANAASFLAVIASLHLIRPRPRPAEARRSSTGSFMREGFDYIRHRPRLWALMGITVITSSFIFPNMAVLVPYYAKHVLHVGADGLAQMMSISGLGALLGAVLLLTIPRERRFQRILLSAAVIMITLSVLAWSRHLWVSVVAIGLQSLAISTSLGLVNIMVQEIVPDELRGRVMSFSTLAFTGVIPFSTLLITSLVDWLGEGGRGMRLELQLAALLYAAGALYFLWQLTRAGEEPDAEGEPAPAGD
jgi:MFS family permease